MDKSQPRRLGKILENVESCSHGKGIFQEGLGINNSENCTKLRMELYIFVPVSINMGFFTFPFFFPCQGMTRSHPSPARCPLAYNRSALNLAVVRLHSLLFHYFPWKHKKKVVIGFFKRKLKSIFQHEHCVSHFFRMTTSRDVSKQQPFGAKQRAPFLPYILFSSYHTQLNRNNSRGKKEGVEKKEKSLICRVVMNRLDWAFTQRAGDGHRLSISGLHFPLATGGFPFLALRPCHH